MLPITVQVLGGTEYVQGGLWKEVGEKVRPYLKNQSGYHHSANIAVNVDFMSPNLLKHLLHAICRMDGVITFLRAP